MKQFTTNGTSCYFFLCPAAKSNGMTIHIMIDNKDGTFLSVANFIDNGEIATERYNAIDAARAEEMVSLALAAVQSR